MQEISQNDKTSKVTSEQFPSHSQSYPVSELWAEVRKRFYRLFRKVCRPLTLRNNTLRTRRTAPSKASIFTLTKMAIETSWTNTISRIGASGLIQANAVCPARHFLFTGISLPPVRTLALSQDWVTLNQVSAWKLIKVTSPPLWQELGSHWVSHCSPKNPGLQLHIKSAFPKESRSTLHLPSFLQ